MGRKVFPYFFKLLLTNMKLSFTYETVTHFSSQLLWMILGPIFWAMCQTRTKSQAEIDKLSSVAARERTRNNGLKLQQGKASVHY